MANNYFQFKQFTIQQAHSAMKVTTDGCLFGAWTANAIQELKLTHFTGLDIGCGTGLLSLMVAQKNPEIIIDSVEIDELAAKEAAQNISVAGKNGTIHILHQDILAYQPDKKYRIIFSNPPFYEKELKGNNSARNTAHHNEGLLIDELLDWCMNWLEDNGRIYLLLPFKRETEILEKIKTAGFFVNQLIRVRPSVRHGYFRCMLEIQFNTQHFTGTQTHELAVKDEQDHYTTAFTSLLRDYYLYL